MSKFSKAAFSAALLLTAGAMVTASPALAQKAGKREKKEEPAGGGGLKVSKEFREPATAAKAALDANDNAAAETHLAAADAVAKTPEEFYFAATLRLPLEARKKNSEGVLKAIDALLASPHTPPADIGRFTYVRGTTLMDLKRPAEALPALLKARELGFQDANMPINIVNAYFGNNNVPAGAQEMDTLIKAEQAAGRKPADNWFSFVIVRLYRAGDRAGALAWTKRAIALYPNQANWERLLFFFRDGNTIAKSERIDLFRLQQSVGALNAEGDFFDYANATSEAGLPWETARVIQQARAKGVVAKAAPSFARLEEIARTRLTGEPPISSVEKLAISEKGGSRAAQTGDAYMAEGNYAKAIEMYRLALQKGVTNLDEVNLHLGVALAKAGQKDEAKSVFAQVKGGTAAEIAGFWTTWIDSTAAAPAPAAVSSN